MIFVGSAFHSVADLQAAINRYLESQRPPLRRSAVAPNNNQENG
jgi:hypothetical protein